MFSSDWQRGRLRLLEAWIQQRGCTPRGSAQRLARGACPIQNSFAWLSRTLLGTSSRSAPLSAWWKRFPSPAPFQQNCKTHIPTELSRCFFHCPFQHLVLCALFPFPVPNLFWKVFFQKKKLENVRSCCQFFWSKMKPHRILARCSLSLSLSLSVNVGKITHLFYLISKLRSQRVAWRQRQELVSCLFRCSCDLFPRRKQKKRSPEGCFRRRQNEKCNPLALPTELTFDERDTTVPSYETAVVERLKC